MDPAALWPRIGLIPQKPHLFGGTVASNLQFGRPDASETEMWAALEAAQAADFVRAMPRGLDAEITQGGTNVPAGSGSDCPSPEPSSCAPRSMSSMTRSPLLT